MGKIVRRLMTGYEDVAEWSPGDPASYEAAQATLTHEIENGYEAVVEIDGRNESVKELPQDAERVILTTAMGGG
ncbi:MAG: hypothetical protein AVDCRST_MAG38-3038 [uncultured Solirubrobacteraceae bacterium]|uniref:MoaD/ThiS family protein n=1 Tax=uncultured Solirubrobacteraceae bacterium TaxID=1162706 RepID=A0A6J4SEY1_9ACTN|nr:MAG: hypothetical protein AVDCRST_MAG38-3038 [uncultured Solirubrobacteraceae bacterium]